jgi:hypothetical protein
MQFKKKEDTVEAMQWTGKNKDEILKFIGNYGCYRYNGFPEGVYLQTYLSGTFVKEGNFIVKEKNGELKSCSPDYFYTQYKIA